MSTEPNDSSNQSVCSEPITQTHGTTLAKPTYKNPLTNLLISFLNPSLPPEFDFLFHMIINNGHSFTNFLQTEPILLFSFT